MIHPTKFISLFVAINSFSYAAQVVLPQESFKLTPTLAGLARPLFRVKNPETRTTAAARFFGEVPSLCNQEKEFLQQRDLICSQKQAALLGIPVSPATALRIAIVSSGGGDAAAQYLLHLLKALKDHGIFPEAVQYLAGISGSTFTIGSLYASNKPFDVYYHEMRERAQHGFLTNPVDQTIKNLGPLLKIIAECIIQRLLAGLPPSGVDPYGAMLLLHYLGPDAQNGYFTRTLSSQIGAMRNYNYPLPLYIASTPIDHGRRADKVEMSPFEIIHYGAQAGIPATSFNWPIGTIIGICGSALSAPARLSVPNLLNRLKPAVLFNPIKKLFATSTLGELSLFPTYSHNFAKHIPNSPYYKKNLLLMVDIGIDVPFSPLLLQAERDIDLFIAIDAGGNVWDSSVLMDIEQYCKNLNIPFPHVYRCNGSSATIFDAGEASSAPVLVYFPISAGDYELTQKTQIADPLRFKRSVEALNLFEEKTKNQVAFIMPKLLETMKTLIKRKELRNGALKRMPTKLYPTAEPIP